MSRKVLYKFNPLLLLLISACQCPQSHEFLSNSPLLSAEVHQSPGSDELDLGCSDELALMNSQTSLCSPLAKFLLSLQMVKMSKPMKKTFNPILAVTLVAAKVHFAACDAIREILAAFLALKIIRTLKPIPPPAETTLAAPSAVSQ